MGRRLFPARLLLGRWQVPPIMLHASCMHCIKRLLLGRWQVHSQGRIGITPGPSLNVRQRYQHRAQHGQVELDLCLGGPARHRAGHGQVCLQVSEGMVVNTDKNVCWEPWPDRVGDGQVTTKVNLKNRGYRIDEVNTDRLCMATSDDGFNTDRFKVNTDSMMRT